jgi:iron complex transport system ATP-binding protein
VTAPLLEFRSVGCRYGDRTALDGVSFGLSGGMLAGVIGPNGSGKSTLLKVAAGLMEPSAGECLINGTDMLKTGYAARAGLLSYCPQEPACAFPFTALQTVLMARSPRLGVWGITGKEDRLAAGEALALMDTAHLADRPVDELSGGERRRVMLARTVAQGCPLLLLDEPTSGLDIGHQVTVMSAFRKLADGGKLLLASMHDLNEAAACCDLVLILKDGALVSSGHPGEIMTPAALKEIFGVDVSLLPGPDPARPIIIPAR